jgi:P-loop containing NTP hydrolase pore-1
MQLHPLRCLCASALSNAGHTHSMLHLHTPHVASLRVQAYMTRVGLFGYPSMADLIKQLVQAGLGASEVFSCGMKAAGIYMGRRAL